MENSEIKTVELSKPLRIGGKEVSRIELRKPNAGMLRGVKLFELVQMDTSAVRQVVPRIATPHISPEEFDALEPADLFKVTTEVVSFFLETSLPPSSP